MNEYDAEQIVYGVVNSTPYTKQVMGRKLAEHFGYTPGPAGKDGSVDGAILDAEGSLVAHFQSKLSSASLKLDEGKILHSDLMRLRPRICIYVAGRAYDSSFKRLILDASLETQVHLLVLKDVFQRSTAFDLALASLPINTTGLVDWSKFYI